ncbi:MAG: hypothetical protein JO283_02205 [Bradyrhizobium sp.]|nr:hypothetical protein [Bradyrhizobium sp.]
MLANRSKIVRNNYKRKEGLGRPPIGKKAMTGAERLRRYRAKRDERLKAEAAAIKPEIDRLKAENVELRRRIIAFTHEVADDTERMGEFAPPRCRAASLLFGQARVGSTQRYRKILSLTAEV